MRRACIVGAVLAVAGCHSRWNPLSSPPPFRAPAARDDHDQARAAEQRAIELEKQLTAQSAPPDCRQACDLAGQICQLSELICAISERHPGDDELTGRCAASKIRCENARKRSTCSCEPPR
jgi:hypothetical protein